MRMNSVDVLKAECHSQRKKRILYSEVRGKPIDTSLTILRNNTKYELDNAMSKICELYKALKVKGRKYA